MHIIFFGTHRKNIATPKNHRSFSQCSHRRQRAARGPVPQAGDAPSEEPGSSPRVSAQEEGIHQVPGEPSGRVGEPEQSPHRGAQIPQRALLPAEERLRCRLRRRRRKKTIVGARHDYQVPFLELLRLGLQPTKAMPWMWFVTDRRVRKDPLKER